MAVAALSKPLDASLARPYTGRAAVLPGSRNAHGGHVRRVAPVSVWGLAGPARPVDNLAVDGPLGCDLSPFSHARLGEVRRCRNRPLSEGQSGDGGRFGAGLRVASVALQYSELESALRAIVQPGTVFELRLLAQRRGRIDGGYFNSIEAAATALSGLQEPYKGIYVTPNPVSPELLARAENRIKAWVEYTTDDKSVERRRWLLIDVDPKRPSGISATNLEHAKSLNLARKIAGMLDVEYGWPRPMMNSSGNGAHLMYPIDAPNNDTSRDLLQLFLKTLAHRFNANGIEVDPTVFNASRIWKLPGTYARKGDNTIERPHRKGSILQDADEFGVVSLAQLQEFIDGNSIPNAAKPVAGTPGKNAAEYPDGERRYRHINNHALRRIDEWVPVYFPGARPYKSGYRVSSEELGRDREEDLTIHPLPLGIKDFGEHDQDDRTEGRRTPISLIAEFHHERDTRAAATALAGTLKLPLDEFTELPGGSVNGDNLNVPDALGPDSYKEIFGGGDFDMKSIRSYADLNKRKFKELKWVINGVLPVGAYILAARPKMRKTWLLMQLSVAVATGSKFMDWQANKGKALLLALEDNERRIKSRIETLHTFDMDMPDLSDFHYFTGGTFPRGQEGADVIARYLDANPETLLVGIDTFAHYREMSNQRDVYLKDYIAVMPLTRLAAERQICIIIVHHEKKGLADTKSGDFIEDVNGSSGLTGGVDGILSIKGRRGLQEENESRKLLITGRDVPFDYEVDMSFDAERGGWFPAARQDAKTAIRGLLTQYPFMMQSEFVTLLPNIPASRVRTCLIEMKFSQEIEQTQYGYKLKG